jgi:hypothetical protein
VVTARCGCCCCCCCCLHSLGGLVGAAVASTAVDGDRRIHDYLAPEEKKRREQWWARDASAIRAYWISLVLVCLPVCRYGLAWPFRIDREEGLLTVLFLLPAFQWAASFLAAAYLVSRGGGTTELRRIMRITVYTTVGMLAGLAAMILLFLMHQSLNLK